MTAKSRYEALKQDRSSYLDRARKCAKVTIPHLMPDEGATGSTKFDAPEQSIGARGVNNVAAKLNLALFPPNAPYFKMEVDEILSQQLTNTDGQKDAIDQALAQYVRRTMTDFEARALRADLHEISRQLVVSGNASLYVPEEGRCRVYRLDRYVCKRDPAGNLIEWVGYDKIAKAALPDDIRNAAPQQQTTSPETAGGIQISPSEDEVELYTHVVLNEEGQYDVYQEALDQIIQGTQGTYLPEELPFLVLRFNKIDGEDYGRGHVEDYLGDLITLENLSKSIREFTSIASRVVPIISPNGYLTPKDLTKAKNGEPVIGNRDDVSFLQIERYNDFRVQKELIDKIESRLSFAFLLNTAIQRSGERVTAEEIRYMARELEDTLGGTYSVQAVDLQLPLARIQIKMLESRHALPELPKNTVAPKVVTGLDALGRGNDLSNLLEFVNIVGNTPAADRMRWENIITRIGNSLNIEMNDLVLSDEEYQEQQNAALQQQMLNQALPNAVNQIGGVVQKSMDTNDQ